MMRDRRPLAVVAVIAAVAVISGCGSSTPTGSAAGGSTAGAGGGAGNSTAARATQAVKFAGCMRSRGVGDFPDPSASGQLTLDGVVNGSSLNPNSPAFTEALRACKSLEPAGFTGAKRSTQQQSAALRFAQCIREHGVADFPDPAAGQPLVDTNRIPSTDQPGGMSALNGALHKCSSLGTQAMGSRQ